MMRLIFALLTMMASSALFAANPMENPGFESDGTGWVIRDQMSSVQADAAAHGGGKVLRIIDADAAAGSSVQSSRFPIKEGADLEVGFWSKTSSAGFISIYLYFYDAAGKLINDPTQKVGSGHPVLGLKEADGQWHESKLAIKAPAGAASVSFWIHSYGSSQGSVDLDDFSVTGAEEGAAPIPMPAAPPMVAKAPAAPLDFSARKTPPMIVIKVDDFRPIDGKVHPLWIKLVNYWEAKKIKGSIGMLMDKNSEASPEYIQWVKDKQASGNIEFWLHGWDHATHEVDGGKYCEFSNRSYEEQKKRFDDSQKIAKEQLGFNFVTFGTPGGGTKGGLFDANTIKVMADDPNMKVWLYPQPMDEQGKKLEADGKVTILDRVWAVNFESSVGMPNYQKFLEGYAANPDRTYFVLQGHPMSWGSQERFEQFTKIIDFLIEQKAEFVTPSELAARLKASH